MTPPPTTQQLNSLPQWAQRYINKIEGERGQAVRALRRYQDDQSPTNMYYQETVSLGEGKDPNSPNAPSFLRRYIQANRIMLVVGQDMNKDDVELEVFHNVDEDQVEVRMPRDFCHMQCHASGTLFILPSPYNPFTKKRR